MNPIIEGDSKATVLAKINEILTFNGLDPNENTDTAIARTMLNQVAVAVGREQLQNFDIGSVALQKINSYMLPPDWLTDISPDAEFGIDYVNARSYRAGYSCVRPSIGYAQGSDGVWEEFAIDQARLTDLGLLVEPAFQNVQTYSGTLSNAAWTKNDVSLGSVVDGYTQVRETATSAFHRIFSSTYSIVSGTTYAQTWFVREAGRQFLVARVNRGDAAQRQVCFDVISGTVVYADPMLTASVVKRGDALQLKISFVAASTGTIGTTGLLTAQAAVVNNTIPSFLGDTGKGFDFLCFNFGAGPDAGSPIFTTSTAVTRAADAVTLSLPSGTYDLTFTFDNDTAQIITGQSGSPVVPTNLNRRIIKYITGAPS